MEYAHITTDDPRYAGERDLRNRILLRPIGLPEHAWEMHDGASFHFVATEEGRVVACAVLRPLPDQPGTAQLLQMAVETAWQGRGVGSELVRHLVNFARSQALREVTCHARETAVSFYRKSGFLEYGEPFAEAGIRHRHMRLALTPNQELQD
jgi:predicted GNAT family N-acyltransferase